jgi:hypothetical protein
VFTKVWTALALAVTFATSHPPYNENFSFASAINGTFYDTKTGYLASLLFVDGKKIGEFPVTSTKVRGAFVCLKSGYVLVGYFKVIQGKLHFSTKTVGENGLICDENFWKQVSWAVTGGGLFLLEGKAVRNVRKREELPSRIVNLSRYSFLLLHNDEKTITGCVSYKHSPYEVARALEGKYLAMLRLDGGSSVIVFKGKKPRSVNNAIGVK